MPTLFQAQAPRAGGRTLFKCCVNTTGRAPACAPCPKCTATTAQGGQCRLSACRDFKLCHVHLKKKYKVVIARSRLHAAGLGLFCMYAPREAPSHAGATPVFVEGSAIAPYGGVATSASTLSSLYDYTDSTTGQAVVSTAPYAWSGRRQRRGRPHGATRYTDAACVRGAAAYANDVQGSQANAVLSLVKPAHGPALVVAVATKPIYAGDEIYISYGEQYWGGDHVAHQTRAVRATRSPQALQGRRGTVVQGGEG